MDPVSFFSERIRLSDELAKIEEQRRNLLSKFADEHCPVKRDDVIAIIVHTVRIESVIGVRYIDPIDPGIAGDKLIWDVRCRVLGKDGQPDARYTGTRVFNIYQRKDGSWNFTVAE